MWFQWGEGRGRGRKRNIPRSRSAVRPQLEWRATPVSTRGPLSVVFLSLSFCPAGRAGASQPPTSLIQASSARPCVAISGNSFRMLPVHCVRSSPLYLSQQALPSTASTCLYFFSDKPSLNPFLFSYLVHLQMTFFHILYTITSKFVLNYCMSNTEPLLKIPKQIQTFWDVNVF